MKNLFFTFLFTAFSAIGLMAQPATGTQGYARQVRFIDGIVIKHDAQPGSTQVVTSQPIIKENNTGC